MGTPTIHPTGTTIYNPEKCFNGYTLFQANEHGATLIDMNGGVVNFWEKLQGFPNKLLPGGYVMGSRGERNSEYGWQDQIDLVQVDWEGNVVWSFDHLEYVEDPGYEARWMARQHHDYQIEGNTVGYYVPGMEPKVLGGKKLLLCHHNVHNPDISEKLLCDDTIIEINDAGEILWRWNCNEHFREMKFAEDAKNTIYRNPGMTNNGGDWMHVNSMSVLGPNQWYDQGDERFHPDNIIIDGRQTNVMAIISKETGKLVWKLGPDFSQPEAIFIQQIIGQHHCHMIPRGLPGEGNILVYDNGGWAGYGSPNPGALTGVNNALRDYSRVIEFNPVTMRVVWECRPSKMGNAQPFHSDHFYSPFISSAQRLPNGNTLITEGSGGRLLEVTSDFEIVWEYISPYWGKEMPINMIYRAYRYPYEYVPQLEKPEEKAIPRIDINDFRMPNAKGKEPLKKTTVEGVWGYGKTEGFCIQSEE
ncbi:MAG: aryl-sulfate sulfotransferase [Dehalobacterium sp.]